MTLTLSAFGFPTSDSNDERVVAALDTEYHEHQEDSRQKVRVWGNTAVITALLWAKGTNQGKPFEYKLWFSDTYVRTPAGWRYVFGQASIPLPEVPRLMVEI